MSSIFYFSLIELQWVQTVDFLNPLNFCHLSCHVSGNLQVDLYFLWRKISDFNPIGFLSLWMPTRDWEAAVNNCFKLTHLLLAIQDFSSFNHVLSPPPLCLLLVLKLFSGFDHPWSTLKSFSYSVFSERSRAGVCTIFQLSALCICVVEIWWFVFFLSYDLWKNYIKNL